MWEERWLHCHPSHQLLSQQFPNHDLLWFSGFREKDSWMWEQVGLWIPLRPPIQLSPPLHLEFSVRWFWWESHVYRLGSNVRKPRRKHCDKLPVFAIVELQVSVCFKVICGRIHEKQVWYSLLYFRSILIFFFFTILRFDS